MDYREREQEPRFAAPGTFEFEFGNRWKELFQMEKVRHEQLDQELRDARERLDGDMDLAYQDYQAELMRQGIVMNEWDMGYCNRFVVYWNECM